MEMFNTNELIKRVIKYIVEGLMIAVASYIIPKKSMNMEEIACIALTAAATFAILDTYMFAVARIPIRVTGTRYLSITAVEILILKVNIFTAEQVTHA